MGGDRATVTLANYLPSRIPDFIQCEPVHKRRARCGECRHPRTVSAARFGANRTFGRTQKLQQGQ